jgi:hypothetical protein
MKKSIVSSVVVIVFAVLSIPGGVLFPASDFKMEKDITVPSGETYPHSVVSFRGKLDIKGTIAESVILVGGRLVLEGVVEEDVICFGSDVVIGKDAHIKRDLFVIGGTLEKDSDAVVDGEYFVFKFDLKKLENSLIPILADTRTFSLFKAIRIIIWFIIALIVFAVVPRKINSAEEMFDTNRLKIGSIGFLSLFSFIFLAFIAIILSFVIIGIPLLIILVLLYFVTYVFGRTVMFYFIGIKLAHLVKMKNIAPAFFILVGVIFYALLKFLPLVGPILLIILNIFELGIGVSFFLRKKLKFETGGNAGA